MQVLQVSFIGRLAVLSTAEHSIGLIKQLFSPVLNLVLVYIKLLRNFRQCSVAFNPCQRDLGFASRQMVSSFASHNFLLSCPKLPQDLHLCYCLRYGVRFCMSRRGNCHDNAVAESFFQLPKRERIRRHIYSTRETARSDDFNYIEIVYNTRRRHGFNNQLSPVEYEAQHQERLASV